MARKRVGIEFEGFEQAIKRLTTLGGNLKATTEKALEETHAHITPLLHKEMAKHKRPVGKYGTGATEQTIVEKAEIEWAGTTAKVPVGFDIKKGGLPSIFLMYGTPRMKKDTKLYAAIFSKKTRDEISKIQEKVFYNEIGRLS